MKKIVLFLLTWLIANLSIFNAQATRFKLGYQKDNSSASKNADKIPDRFPTELIPHIDQYFTIIGSAEGISLAFTPNKNYACDFEVEEVVRTTLGTVYYRITYQDAVLIWNANTKQFVFISKDEKLNPLKTQIQWMTLVKWLRSKTEITPIDNTSIEITPV